MYFDDDRRKVVADSANKDINQQAVDKSRELVDKGAAYASLKDHRGWKFLLEEFIEPRLSVDRFLSAEKEELPYIQHEMKILTELLNFIDNRISQSNIERRLLEKLKKL